MRRIGRFFSEPLKPITATCSSQRMAGGEPGLSQEFKWREERIRVSHVLREWRETGPCRHGSGERYVRKHWYEIEDSCGRVLRIYFERHCRSRCRKDRWYLFSMAVPTVGSHLDDSRGSSKG